ncbi:hypothetical protein CCACVL1_09471 [Corchorus capsularis]|uniref:Uncharacterized protein n=1 Tax=Corchorus capsularis TaxID=210143 RepID=A0A1R3IW06_COCAP|nr:hypothetical protein CCACVL1_09471 [Corchorus capsularis]
MAFDSRKDTFNAELSNARAATIDDATAASKTENSAFDSEDTAVATWFDPTEYSELCVSTVENPSKMEDESESTETGDFIQDAIPTIETKLLTLHAAMLVPIELSNAFLLEGPKLSTGLVVEPYFMLNTFTQKSTSMVGFKGLPLVMMELPLDVFIGFWPALCVKTNGQ